MASHSGLTPREIVSESMKIAADICIYTNDNFSVETIP
jgi:ATP-dependent HslUV protease subunit HslV